MPDDPLHDLEVAEAPLLEGVLDVDELLAGLVDAPVLGGRGIDGGEDLDEVGVGGVRLGPVAVEQSLRDGVPLAGEVGEELVVERRLVEQLVERGPGALVVGEDVDHVGVLVAEQELDLAVLRGLEARAGGEEGADLGVLARGQRREHRPLVGERVLDVLDPRHPLEGGGEVVGAQQGAG